jgi:uncharacterized protein
MYSSEVDFVLGDHEVAVEVKANAVASKRYFKGLKSFSEEYTVKNLILVRNDHDPRQIDRITVLPWKIFLEKLLGGEIIA